MSKMKKRRLSWKASNSSQVVGYRLYWAEEGGVDYDAQFVELGNVTEIVMPDDVVEFTPGNGPVEFGITAIDELGNESDMVTLFAPYQFSVPDAPANLVMETMQEFHTPLAPPATAADGEDLEESLPEEAEMPRRILQPVSNL